MSETADIVVGSVLPGTVVGWNPQSFINRAHRGIPAGLTNVIAIDAGAEHVIALKEDGTVVSWGNDHLQQVSHPRELRDVVAIDAGSYHSVALRGDGTVVSWGLVSNDLMPRGLTNVVTIAAGRAHTMALKRNGTVVAWGEGAASIVPEGLSGVVAVAAGHDLSVALLRDGSVVEWGNLVGCKPRPTLVTNVVTVATAWSTTIVIKRDGRVEAWGIDCTGTLPPASLRAIAVAGDRDQSFAILPDGTLSSWGRGGVSHRPPNLGRTTAIAVGGLVYEIVGPLPAAKPRLVASGDGLEVRWRSAGALGPSSLQVAETVEALEWRPHPVTAPPENGWIRVPWNAEAPQQFFRLVGE